MALNNVWVEPRRELTEQLVGLGVMAAVLSGVWLLSYWVEGVINFNPVDGPYARRAISILVSLASGAVLWGVVFALTHVMHWVGEGTCNWLARKGMELRPKQRYARNYSGQIIKVP